MENRAEQRVERMKRHVNKLIDRMDTTLAADRPKLQNRIALLVRDIEATELEAKAVALRNDKSRVSVDIQVPIKKFALKEAE